MPKKTTFVDPKEESDSVVKDVSVMLKEVKKELPEKDVPEYKPEEIEQLEDEEYTALVNAKGRSYNFYDDRGNRIYVKKQTTHSWTKPTQWNKQCVQTTFQQLEDGTWKMTIGLVLTNLRI